LNTHLQTVPKNEKIEQYKQKVNIVGEPKEITEANRVKYRKSNSIPRPEIPNSLSLFESPKIRVPNENVGELIESKLGEINLELSSHKKSIAQK